MGVTCYGADISAVTSAPARPHWNRGLTIRARMVMRLPWRLARGVRRQPHGNMRPGIDASFERAIFQ